MDLSNLDLVSVLITQAVLPAFDELGVVNK
jgi:hypothetical protein